MENPRKILFSSMGISLIIGIILVAFNLQIPGWSLLFLSVILFFIATSPITNKDKRNEFITQINDYIKEHELQIDKTYFSQLNKTNISFSHDEGILYLFNSSSPSFSKKLIDYKDIVESHVISNGETVTKTARVNQAAGMLVGGALLGAGGSIIGGLTSKKTSSSVIKDLELKLVVNDLNNPVITIPLKDNNEDLTKSSPIYKELYDRAYEIHKTFELIIKQEDKKQNSII